MTEAQGVGPTPVESPDFNASNIVNIPDIDRVELSCTVFAAPSVQIFIPEAEAREAGIESARTQGEVRRAEAEAARLAGWPAWVKPKYVRIIQRLGCHEQVRDMLERGYGLVAIANKIHEHEELLNSSVGTIENLLTHYRATVPKHLMARRVLRVPEAEQSLRKGIDVRQKLEDLYAKMEARIEIGFNREKQMSFLMTGMEKQFEVAAKLLKDIYQFDKEMGFGEYGALTRDGKPTQPQLALDLDKVYSRTGINETMMDPAKRMRVVSVVERLLDLGKKADEMGIMPPEPPAPDHNVIEGEATRIDPEPEEDSEEGPEVQP